MEEVIKVLMEQQKVITAQMKEQNRKIEEQQRLFGQMVDQFKELEKGNSEFSSQNLGFGARNGDMESGGPRNAFHFNPKVEFPSFDGVNVRNWIKKCVKYLSLCKIPDNQKVDLASMYLHGRAEIWYGSYSLARRNISWEEFVVDVCARFKDEMGYKVVEEFNRLQQWGALDEYVDKFEELRALLLMKNSLLPDEHFLDSFVGGLKPHLKSFVRAFHPKTLTEAMEYARCQEETVQALKMQEKSSKFTTPVQKSVLPTPSKMGTTAFSHQSNIQKNPPRFIPASERVEKIAKGLCYYCDKPFERGHKCANRTTQLFLVEVPGLDAEEIMGEDDGAEWQGEDIDSSDSTPCISVSALNGDHGF